MPRRCENASPLSNLISFANQRKTCLRRLYGATYFQTNVYLPDLPREFLRTCFETHCVANANNGEIPRNEFKNCVIGVDEYVTLQLSLVKWGNFSNAATVWNFPRARGTAGTFWRVSGCAPKCALKKILKSFSFFPAVSNKPISFNVKFAELTRWNEEIPQKQIGTFTSLFRKNSDNASRKRGVFAVRWVLFDLKLIVSNCDFIATLFVVLVKF